MVLIEYLFQLDNKLKMVIFVMPLFVLSFAYQTSAVKVFFSTKTINTGRVQYTDAVAIFEDVLVMTCGIRCQENLRCMTFFYNSLLRKCVLHSKTFHYQAPNTVKNGWKMYLIREPYSTCPSDIAGFVHYRELDLCYNFNPEHNIDYLTNIPTTCSSYGASLLRIDTQVKQTYMEHVLVGRPNRRVAIEGHSFNPGNVWTLNDGTPLPYTNWRSGGPLPGKWNLQLFTNDEWTEQYAFDSTKYHLYICERR